MRIQKNIRKNQKKTIIATIVIILVMILGSLAYVFAFNGKILGWGVNSSTTNNEKPTQEQIDSANSIKKETINAVPASTDSSSKTDNQTPPPATDKLDLTITVANINHIRLLIEGLHTTGACTLVLSQTNTTPITQSAPLMQSGPNSSTCKGFDYAALEGTGWKAVISVDTGSATGSISQDIK